jgi:hypothetical protein
MRRALSRSVFLAGLLVAAACTAVVVRPRLLTDAYRASPVAADEVAVVRTLPLDSVPEACVRVAALQGSGQQDFSDASELVAEMRKAAGSAGANVVAILSWEEAGRGERVLDVLLRTGVDRDALGLALRCPAETVAALARR